MPRSLTRKGRQTRASLLEAAREVFREQGYYSASVSEICRRSRMSQGAFYQYFKNKEQALLELNDAIIVGFWRNAEALPLDSSNPEERLRQVVRLLFGHARDYYYFHRILGEFELIDPAAIGYYDSIARYFRRFLRQEQNNGCLRAIDTNILAYGLMGMAGFHAMDWRPEGQRFQLEELVDWAVKLIRKGVTGPKPWYGPANLAVSPSRLRQEVQLGREENLTQGQATAQAIFRAAETVFGQYGFNRATISEITREAEVAQGTFYVHFKSKGDLMQGFVRYLSHEIRRELKMATAHLRDRRDVELEGVRAFFRFIGSHRRIYRVVVESETMGQKMAMWYYKKMAEGYTRGLAEGVARGEIRSDVPVLFMVRSLMGFHHMIALKWLVWNSSPHAEVSRQLQGEIVGFLVDGLDPL